MRGGNKAMESEAAGVLPAVARIRHDDITVVPEVSDGKPIVVVSEALLDYVNGAMERCQQLVVSTKEEFDLASAFINELGRSRAAVKERALAIGRPFREFSNMVSTAAKRVTDSIEASEAAINAKMVEFRRKENEARVKAMEEADRLRREAEAAAREAAARQEAAAKQLDKATTEAKFEQGAAAFDEGVQAQAEADAKAAQAQAALAQVQQEATKSKGTRVTKVPVILSFDLKALPTTYHMIDEVKVKKHILDGTITAETPGIKFRIDEKFSGTGR